MVHRRTVFNRTRRSIVLSFLCLDAEKNKELVLRSKDDYESEIPLGLPNKEGRTVSKRTVSVWSHVLVDGGNRSFLLNPL